MAHLRHLDCTRYGPRRQESRCSGYRCFVVKIVVTFNLLGELQLAKSAQAAMQGDDRRDSADHDRRSGSDD